MAVTLNAQSRSERGKGAIRKLRAEGFIPAVVYGRGDSSIPLSVRAQELTKLLASISVDNTIIDLAVDGKKKTTPTLIREVQYHAARKAVLHVDFLLVHAGEKIHLDVPIRLSGSAVGVRDNGGILQEVLREVRVECLPGDIPEAIDVDISDLDIGDSVVVGSVSLPGVKVLNDPELVLVSVVAPTVSTAEDEAAAEGEAGSGEPEVISRGEDGDEED